MAGQSLVFDFASRGAGQLAADFTKTGSTAALAAKGARLCADALAAQERAGKSAANGLQTAERVSALLAVTEHELDNEIEKTNRALLAQGVAAKAAGKGASDARGGFRGLIGEITGFGAASDAATSGGNKFKLALAGINLASGVLEPALAGVVVAVGGLAAGLTAAAAGLGAFGLVAGANFTAASTAATQAKTAQDAHAAAVAKVTGQYQYAMSVAKTQAQRQAAYAAEQKGFNTAELAQTAALSKAYAGLSPAQVGMAKQISVMKDQWQSFTATFAPMLNRMLTTVAPVFKIILGDIGKLATAGGTALQTLLPSLGAAIGSSGFQKFITMLASQAGPAIVRIGVAVGNVVVGIGGILKAFMPTSQQMLAGIDKITAKFREWGTTLSGGTGFQSLMQTFRTETPQAMAILTNLGTVIANVGKAMFGLSSFSNSKLLLSALTPLSGVMASLSKNTDLVRVAMYALLAVKIGQQFTWVTTAWQGIVKFAAAAEGATVAETIAAAATRAWGLAMDALPWVALAAAVVAVAVLIIKYHTQIWAFMQRVWHDILGFIMGVWNWVKTNWPLLLGIITGPIGLAILWVVQHFGQITTAVKTVLNAVATVWSTSWNAMKSAFQSVLNGITTSWNAVWNTLKAAFRVFVVDGILGPLGLIVNGAAKAFGWVPGLGGKLKSAATAFNTFRANVNSALGGINGRTVNVSVAMTSATNPYPGGISGRAASGMYVARGTPGVDDQLILAQRGELVVPTRLVQAGAVDHLRGRIPGFASGGQVGVNVAPHTPTAGQVTSTLMASVTKLAQAFAKAAAAAAAFSAKVPNVGSGVARWAPLVKQALAMEGLSPGLLSRVLYQMQTESGGNPNIFNTTDINAQHGTPSGGLMQVISPTFRAYHWPGTSNNLLDPLANIAAALNYARHTYGPTLMNSRGMGIGSGRGYAYGTPSASAGWAWVGERGPELVNFRGGEQVTPGGGDLLGELRALRAEVRQLTGVAAGIPAATGHHVGGAINSSAGAAGFRRRYPQGGA